MPLQRPAQIHLLSFALLVFASLGACTRREMLGTDCPLPERACAGKACGEICFACATGAVTPDVAGRCGADGVCAVTDPVCGPGSTDGQAGASGSLGCGKSGAVTGVQADRTITVSGQTRTYVLSVPAGYTGTTPLALIFAWHGPNMTGALARSAFNLESKSDGAAIFVYPDGVASGTWDLSAESADIQLFTALVDSISSRYCIDSDRIFSTGHGAGAFLTNTLGCYRGDVLRAIAPVEGGGPPSMLERACTTKVAAMVVHGRNDPVVPFALGQAARDYLLAQNGCTLQTAAWPPEPACAAYQGCQSDLPLIWCVHDEGQAWPNLTSDCTGGTCMDAGPLIWAFFSSFH